MLFDAVETPAVLVDTARAHANITRFQAHCDALGIAVRPHIKTHKLPMFAKAQIAAGAVGVTCQKISEAEAMISEGGIDDILLTYNILGPEKLRRLRALADRVRLSVVADNATVIEGLSATFTDPAAPLRVLVECETGAERCGVVTGAEALALARLIEAAPGLHFGGLMTYPAPSDPAPVNTWLTQTKALIEAAGIAVPCVSAGGTPNMWKADQVPVATEWRAGTYIYNDRSLVTRGTCTLEDCALTILATVVSHPVPNRAIIDAGSKVLTSDLLGLDGYGHVLGHPEIRINSLSEEHGRLVSPTPIPLVVGDRVRIVPNHACVVTNMMNRVALVEGDRFLNYQPVVARGCVT